MWRVPTQVDRQKALHICNCIEVPSKTRRYGSRVKAGGSLRSGHIYFDMQILPPPPKLTVQALRKIAVVQVGAALDIEVDAIQHRAAKWTVGGTAAKVRVPQSVGGPARQTENQ
jgi:hypothetical protein